MLSAIMHFVQRDDVVLVDQMLDDVADGARRHVLDLLVLGHVIQQSRQSMSLQMPVQHFQAFGIKRPFFLAGHIADRLWPCIERRGPRSSRDGYGGGRSVPQAPWHVRKSPRRASSCRVSGPWSSPMVQESRNLSGTGNIGHITNLIQSGLREPGRTGRASAGSSCRRACAMPCRDSSSPMMSRNCGHDRLLLRKGRVGHTGMNYKA